MLIDFLKRERGLEEAKAELEWNIKYPDIRSIIETAWNWHKKHPKGFAD